MFNLVKKLFGKNLIPPQLAQSDVMNSFFITRSVLELFDDCDGDFEKLSDSRCGIFDRRNVTDKQIVLFSEYVDLMKFTNNDVTLPEIQVNMRARISEIEPMIEPYVVEIIKKRIALNILSVWS